MNKPIATTAAARSSTSVPRSCKYLKPYISIEGNGFGRYGRASVSNNGGCVESYKTTFSEGGVDHRWNPQSQRIYASSLAQAPKKRMPRKMATVRVINRTDCSYDHRRLTTISMPHVLCSTVPLASVAHRLHISPEEMTTEFRSRNASGSRQKMKYTTRTQTDMTCKSGSSFWINVFGFGSILG